MASGNTRTRMDADTDASTSSLLLRVEKYEIVCQLRQAVLPNSSVSEHWVDTKAEVSPTSCLYVFRNPTMKTIRILW